MNTLSTPLQSDLIGIEGTPRQRRVVPLSTVAEVINGYPFDAAAFNQDAGHPLVRIRDIGRANTETLFDGEFVDAVAITSEDVLVGMDGDFNVGRWKGEGRALLNQRVCCIRGMTRSITRLLEYALPQPLKAINDVTYSTTVKHLSSGDVKKIRVPIPNDERDLEAILGFLDRETGKIDALVEQQRRLIELLKEKRQAVISHAVTKGLDPNAKMKPSGVEWLGDVPEHWDVVPCGYRYEVQLGRMLNEERSQGDDLRPYLRVFDVQWGRINVEDLPLMDFPPEARQRYRLAPGDLLVNEGGSYVGRSAIWRGELEECYYQKALHRLRPRDRARDTADFLLLVMEMATKVGAFVAGGNQTTIDHLTAEQLRGQRFPYPPHAEQVAIAEFVEKTIKQVEQLSQEVETAIRLLNERRAALISAAVTGKIDVRTISSAKSAGRDRFRLVVGAEIVERLAHKKAFGRVKLQKLLYLAEAEAGISELKGEYLREAAGPLDRDLIADVEARLQGRVEVEQQGGAGSPVTYRVLGARGAHRKELDALLGDRREALDRLIELLGDMDTSQVEAAATLYAVWNDALLDGRQPSDEEIVSGVLNDWHPEKAKKFMAEELDVRLGWMKRNHLVPSGTGPRTVTGRLFP